MRRETTSGLPRGGARRVAAIAIGCGLLVWSCGKRSSENGTRAPSAGQGGAAGGVTATTGGAAGAPSLATSLGQSCESSADCGGDLECLTAESVEISGQGPAHGYCTTRCDTMQVCEAITPGAVCVQFEGPLSASFCMLGCEPGPVGAVDFARSKCDARVDVACSLLAFEGTDVPASACMPRCRSDADCDGRICDQFTGLCGDRTAPGDPYWSSCDVEGEPTCRGYCLDMTDGATPGVCVEFCTQGTYGCGWTGRGSAEGFCDYFYGEEMSAAGDEGFCIQMCDCNDDCRHPGTRCYALDLNSQRGYARKGLCWFTSEGEPTLECGAGGAAGAGGGSGTAGAVGAGAASGAAGATSLIGGAGSSPMAGASAGQ